LVIGRSKAFDLLYDNRKKEEVYVDSAIHTVHPSDEVSAILYAIQMYQPQPLAVGMASNHYSIHNARAKLALKEFK
jgi:hypothetical protein